MLVVDPEAFAGSKDAKDGRGRMKSWVLEECGGNGETETGDVGTSAGPASGLGDRSRDDGVGEVAGT